MDHLITTMPTDFMPKLAGGTVKAGVIGYPVSHSLSPKLHRHWLQEYDIDGEYIPLEVRPGELYPTMLALAEEGFRGFNVTLPYKQEIMKHLHEVDDIARAIGAVNTVVIDEIGIMNGTNTDAYGFIENLKAHVALEHFTGHALVLGAGGGARAVVWALVDAGFKKITIAARSVEKAKSFAAFGDVIDIVGWDAIQSVIPQASLLVNTTPLGMNGKEPLDISLESLPEGTLVTDLVYAPLHTDFLKRAEVRGNIIVDGLGMLIYQAIPGFAAWFGARPDITGDDLPYLKKLLMT